MEQAFTQISDTATCIICHKYVGVHILCQLQGYRSEVAICEMCVFVLMFGFGLQLSELLYCPFFPPIYTFNWNLVLITLISVSLF